MKKKLGIKKARYEAWRRWVARHLLSRRSQSLKSYHKNKGKSSNNFKEFDIS